MASHDREGLNRPDPDALLALAEKDRRGKLTIFLGAAPGVGKTYAMLARARRLKTDGVEVVVGLVETHARAETSALLEGLDVLPRLEVDYRGKMLKEFDLDAALARKPRVIIVDELAHSNPEGFRHPKRYQDIEELISAGSMSGRRSISSILKAFPISSLRLPVSPFVNGCRTRC